MKRIVCEGDSSRTRRDVASFVIRGTRLRIMTARRRVVELSITDEDLSRLMAIARSRTEPASRVERARMLLAYRDDPSFFAVGQALGVHHQTVCNAPCSTDFSRPGDCRRDPRGKATGRSHRQQADGRHPSAPRLAGSACRAGVRVSPIAHPLRFHSWLGSLVLTPVAWA